VLGKIKIYTHGTKSGKNEFKCHFRHGQFVPHCSSGQRGVLTSGQSQKKSGHLWCFVWLTVIVKRKNGSIASWALSCRNDPTWLLEGRLVFCRMLWIALPFPQLQRILMSEGWVLHLSDALFIGTFFLSFMSPITIGDVGLPVRGSMWVKHLYIQVRFLKTTSPKAIHCNVQSCSIHWIRGGSCQGFTREWL